MTYRQLNARINEIENQIISLKKEADSALALMAAMPLEKCRGAKCDHVGCDLPTCLLPEYF